MAEITLKGLLLFPRKEDGKVSACLAMDESETNLYRNYVAEVEDETGLRSPKLSDVKFNEVPFKGLNVKSSFKVAVMNSAGQPIETSLDQIAHGSKVMMMIQTKEYDYMKRKGLTTYVTAVVIEKMNEVKHRDLFAEMAAQRRASGND